MSQLPYNYPVNTRGGQRIDPQWFDEFERWLTTRGPGPRDPSPTRPDIPGDFSRGGIPPWLQQPPYYPGPYPQDEVNTRSGSCGGGRDVDFSRASSRSPLTTDNFPGGVGGDTLPLSTFDTGAIEVGVLEELRNCSRSLQALGKDLDSGDSEVRRDAKPKAIACANFALGLLYRKGVKLPDERFAPSTTTTRGGESSGTACREFGEAIDRALRDAFGSRGGGGREAGIAERIGELIDKGNGCVRSF